MIYSSLHPGQRAGNDLIEYEVQVLQTDMVHLRTRACDYGEDGLPDNSVEGLRFVVAKLSTN